MPWIYNRAQRVLVWLGPPEQREWTGWKAFCEGKELYTSTKGLDLALEELCEKEYWKRVWIIQEIGRARRVSVCFGEHTLDWKRFIKGLEEFKMLRASAPMKLQKQLNEKYENGHRLQSLVELHQDKLCKEARDHVYGFVGLAIDAQEGFPVDYEKSLYEVWKDVMIYKNQTDNGPSFDVLQFGKIVRHLLGGKDIASPKELELDIAYNTAPPTQATKCLDISSLPEGLLLTVPSRLAGKIVHFGPTLTELHSDFKSSLKWRASINRWLLDHNRPMAREECDFFAEVLEGMDDEELAKVGVVGRTIEWKRKSPMPKSIFDCDMAVTLDGIDDEKVGREGSCGEGGEPRVFLIGGVNRYDKTASGMMGLGPSAAQVGDYVCQIQGLEKAIILRRENKRLKIVGTAGLAHSFHEIRAKNAREEEVDTSCKFAVADYSSETNMVYLFVDMPLAYDLLG
ncbi:hypothetical protein B0J14DRAFT_467697 [Halenospora varia]|nr:hypothetical protein B0J14DRAFT_467697 [Halenospora varia]